jgi:hypothetical protein
LSSVVIDGNYNAGNGIKINIKAQALCNMCRYGRYGVERRSTPCFIRPTVPPNIGCPISSAAVDR